MKALPYRIFSGLVAVGFGTVGVAAEPPPAAQELVQSAVPQNNPDQRSGQHPEFIIPGELWLDQRGLPIQAHGGGILKQGDTYFWFGEDRSPNNTPGSRYVACYASKDLLHWEFRNQVFQSADPEHLGPRWVLERPKVFHNPKTGKYVMYMHIDGTRDASGEGSAYTLARVGIAVSDTIDGNYTYLRSFRPLGKESRDIGQFIDDDGTPYLIFESRPTKGFYIAGLSGDYLDVVREVCFIKSPLEGGALVHHDGRYYLIGSYMTGWDPNPNQYATSLRLEGPWSEFKDIAPPASKTYGAQSTTLLKIVGTKKTSIIFLGDLWRKKNLPDSRYYWMPVEIGGDHLALPAPRPWMIDLLTGETRFSSTPQGTADGTAVPSVTPLR